MTSDISFAEIQRKYLKIFIALIILTGLTVGMSFVHIGESLNIIVGVLIALLKASLVAWIFMHLKFDNRRLRAFVIVPSFFFLVLVLTLTMLGL